MLQPLIGPIHGTDFILTHLLLGFLIFQSAIVTAGGSNAIRLLDSWRRNVLVLIRLGFFSSLLWLFLSVHEMTESWSPGELWNGFTETSFSHVWCLKLFFLIVLHFFISGMRKIKHFSTFTTFSALFLPFAFVLTSHSAASENHQFGKMMLDWTHSLSVGIWSGGLLALHNWIGQKMDSIDEFNPQMTFSVVTRFSHFAMTSTALIAVSGFTMSWANGVSLFAPWESEYGKLVLTKTIVFSMALVAAIINQFVHLKRWNPNAELKFNKAIRREIKIELILIVIIFAIAGFLTRTELPNL